MEENLKQYQVFSKFVIIHDEKTGNHYWEGEKYFKIC